MAIIKIDENNPQVIDEENELLAIFSFIKKTWHIPQELSDENLLLACRVAFESGLAQNKIMIDNYEISNVLYELQIKRMNIIKNFDAKNIFKDFWFNFFMNFSNGKDDIKKYALKNFDFSSEVSKLLRTIRNITGIKNIAPKGYGKYEDKSYSELKNIYEDYSDMGYYDNPCNGLSRDEWEEQTINVHYFASACSFPFREKIALHNILYSDINQGRKPLKELFGAVFSHGMSVGGHNYTFEAYHLLQDLKISDEFQEKPPLESERLLRNEFINDCLSIRKENEE